MVSDEIAQRVDAAAVELGEVIGLYQAVGRARRRAEECTVDQLYHDLPSARFSSSFTRFGFALPAVAFITWPTRKPNVARLARAVLRDGVGVSRQHVRDQADDLRLVVDLRQPFGARRSSSADWPGREHLLEHVLGHRAADRALARSSASSPASRSGGSGDEPMSRSCSFSLRASSPMHPVARRLRRRAGARPRPRSSRRQRARLRQLRGVVLGQRVAARRSGGAARPAVPASPP